MSREHIKHLLRERLIREGEKEIPELKETAKIVYRSLIDAVHNIVMSIYNENGEVPANELFDSLDELDISDEVLSELEPETFDKLQFFVKAINDSKMLFTFEHTKETGLTGEYESESDAWDEKGSKSLIIYYNAKEITSEILDRIKHLSLKKEDHRAHMAIKKVLSTYRRDMIRTMVHELQHAYDDYRSGGVHTDEEDKEITKQISDLSKKFGPDDEIDEETGKRLHALYISLPFEIWARFAEVVSNMEEDNTFKTSTDFNSIIEIFKQQIEGFDIMSERMKRKIIKTLYKFWYSKK